MDLTEDKVNFVNLFLPSVENEKIVQEEKTSTAELLQCLELLEKKLHDEDEIDMILYGRCIRKIKVHQSMKYYFSNELRTRVVTVLLAWYRQENKISISIKSKILGVVKCMLRKKWERLELTLDWRLFWDDLLSLIFRDKRYEITGAENVLVNYLQSLVDFIADTRNYFNPHDLNSTQSSTKYGPIVDLATSLLKDTRITSVFEGVMLLDSCLPTKYEYYDELLPQWFEKWSSIDNNFTWDLCWILLMARAIKHSKTFDWPSVAPFLLSKLRDSLHLPSAGTVRMATSNSFPRTVPSYYMNIMSHIKDPHKKLIQKLGKILVHIANNDPLKVSSERLMISLPALVQDSIEKRGLSIPGFTDGNSSNVSRTCNSIIEFLQSMRPYHHPSNAGNYVASIATLITQMIKVIGKYLGSVVGTKLLGKTDPSIVDTQTLLFLNGNLFTMTLEGLYTKNNFASKAYAFSLKNFICLDPSLAHIVFPFLMDALEPKSVNQPQQTVTAFYSLGGSFRNSLFPSPVALEYVADILRLSLPGIDSSDAAKTSVSFDLLSNIFAWIPISTSLRPKLFGVNSYLSLVDSRSAIEDMAVGILDDNVTAQFETLIGYITSEWIPLVMERIFVLIDAIEPKMKGVAAPPAISAISYFTGFLFQAIDSKEVQLFDDIEKNLVKYLTTRAPSHTAKVCAKLVESFAFTSPHRTSNIISAIAANQGLNASIAADKLAFNIRVIGGCFRQNQGTHAEVGIEKALSMLQDPKIIYHEEKSVRKATGKLFKDILKGLVSRYPIEISPASSRSSLLAEPFLPANCDMQWYDPSADNIKKAVDLLKTTTASCLSEINSALSFVLELESGGESTGKAISSKHCEEMVGYNLALLRRVYRGIAELIIDNLPEHLLGKINVSTGRKELLDSIDVSDATYVRNYRRVLLNELISIHEQLEKSRNVSGFSNLRNSEYIAKQWMKVVELVVIRRAGFLKDDSGLIKWLKYQKSMSSTIFCESVRDTLKAGEVADKAKAVSSPLTDRLYWKFHDQNSNNTTVMPWLQHIVRAKALSSASNRVLVDAEDSADPVMRCLHIILELARHEYDKIRPQARSYFESLASHLGFKANATIRSLISLLKLPNATYYQTASTLVTLRQNSVMRRVLRDVDMKIEFLDCLSHVQRNASNIMELEKREKVLASLTDVFTKYCDGWSNTVKGQSLMQQRLLAPTLDMFGFVSDVTEDAMQTDEEESSLVKTSQGIRFDSFYAYILLHLCGTALLQQTAHLRPLWRFIMTQLTTSHGQPTQYIALALLNRFVEISYKSKEQIGSLDCYAYIRQDFDVLGNSSNVWKELYVGLSRCHSQSNSEDGASSQWSAGIDHIIQASSFLRVVKSRKFACRRYEQNLYSSFFRRDIASLVFTLFDLGFVPLETAQNKAQFIQQIFKVSEEVVPSNESEKRTLSDVKAEIFGGILRAFFVRPNLFGGGGEGEGDDCESVLRSSLAESIEGLSIDFCRDWQEAVYFAFEAVPMNDINSIAQWSLSNFSTCFTSESLDSSSGAAGAGAGAGVEALDISVERGDRDKDKAAAVVKSLDEGFSRQGKILMMVNAILQGDSNARIFSGAHSPLLIAEAVHGIISSPESNMIAQYRTSRGELTGLVQLLLDYSGGTYDLSQVFAKIHAKVHSAVATGEASDAPEAMDTAETASAGETAATPQGAAAAAVTAESVARKNAAETTTFLISKFLSRLCLRVAFPLALSLSPVVVDGIQNSEIEVAKLSTDTLQMLFHGMRPTLAPVDEAVFDPVVAALAEYASHSSWRVKEAAIKSAIGFMSHNWFVLNASHRKALKDIFANGINDAQLNIQDIAKAGMVAYLAFKTNKEMQGIAEAYTRNSETLAARERQKRKAQREDSAAAAAAASTGSARADAVYLTTVQMMSCVILCFPYDLPAFLPALLTSFLRHTYYDSTKAIILKTVQSFKRTHQDRWEDFQKKFTKEQLDELQGAGAAHYFS